MSATAASAESYSFDLRLSTEGAFDNCLIVVGISDAVANERLAHGFRDCCDVTARHATLAAIATSERCLQRWPTFCSLILPEFVSFISLVASSAFEIS